MGFKILKDFNLAILEKQLWRLHNNPNSLWAQCYKAKYYPNTDVLHSTVGYNPSFAWRSIHQSLWIINKGSCWKIGNGQKVRVLEDNWLPYQNGFRVVSPNTNSSIPLLVKDFLSVDPPDWNDQLLQELLLPIDSHQVLQLPIIHPYEDDELMWMFENNGNYTVKSGYLAMQIWKTRGRQEASTSTTDNQI